MATYKSLIEISGSIDGLVFYNLNGIPVVRKKSGFNKSDYANNPKYAKVRENSSEFGHCSKSGKMIRNALSEYLKDNSDKYLYQKFAKVMTQIKDLDRISPKGKRNIPAGLAAEGGYALLRKFKFGNTENLEGSAMRADGLFGTEINIASPKDFDQFDFVTLRPNFTTLHCVTDVRQIGINPKQKGYEIEKSYDDKSDIALYFLALKKGGKTIKMGFI